MCFLEDTTILKVNTTYERAGEKILMFSHCIQTQCVQLALLPTTQKAMLDIFLLPSRCNTHPSLPYFANRLQYLLFPFWLLGELRP